MNRRTWLKAAAAAAAAAAVVIPVVPTSRKVFEVGKAGAIAQDEYESALAVMDAWESGMLVGVRLAPIVAAAYAAAAAMNSTILISNIRSKRSA